MRRSVWVVLALLSVLLVPSRAYASDVNYVGSFASGFDALLGNGVNENVTPERDFQESYVEDLEVKTPRLRSDDNAPVDSMGGIQQVVDGANTVRWGTTDRDLLNALRIFIGAGSNAQAVAQRELLIIVPISIVFMWWGVRKAKNMIMVAFRKGKVIT